MPDWLLPSGSELAGMVGVARIELATPTMSIVFNTMKTLHLILYITLEL